MQQAQVTTGKSIMTKTVIPCTLALMAGFALAVPSITASDEDRGKQSVGERDDDQGRIRDDDERDRPPRERDGNRRPPEGERGRGPRDGNRRPSRPGGPIMALLDTNHNGVLESEEIDQAIVILRKRDRNRDGKLTSDEIGQPRDGERSPMRGGDRRPEGRPAQGTRPSPEQIKERFRQADKDGDGKLSKEETSERMRGSFDRIDADGSGFIEQKELEEMVRRFQQGGRGPRDGDRPGGDRGERGRGDGEQKERRRPDTE